MSLTFDIFCRVVDNYGDIGVCWRLARRLTHELGNGSVRLWVDDLRSFARIAEGVDIGAYEQRVRGITVCHWGTDFEAVEPAQVVIEAFACELPSAFVRRMDAKRIWINLEYLSAEDWVESCHGLPSPQPGGRQKHFFFPGFTSRTGGLLREPGLVEQRKAWQADATARMGLLRDLGVPPIWRQRLEAGAQLVYVFSYPEAPIQGLLDGLAASGRQTLILMPERASSSLRNTPASTTASPPGTISPETSVKPSIHPHQNKGHDTEVAVHTLPFVDQTVFDQLLWSSDLNIVRGEDSLIRAVWAGRPMIWQPYLQEGDLHLEKLEAWLDRTPYPELICELMRAWSTGDAAQVAALLPAALDGPAFDAWNIATEDYCADLTQTDDLATRLLRFCTDLQQTR